MVFTIYQPGLNSATVNENNHKYLTEIENNIGNPLPQANWGRLKINSDQILTVKTIAESINNE